MVNNPKSAALRQRSGQAFTLIELLVVIAIISLLVTIILPSLSRAKTLTRIAQTRSLLKTIETALEMFHDDRIADGEYPPSGGTINTVTSATIAIGDPFSDSRRTNEYFTGAETLLWAMMGADFHGTPGFDGNVGVGTGELHQLDGSGNPMVARSGPFMDVTKTTLLKVDEEVAGDISFDFAPDRQYDSDGIAAEAIGDPFGGAVLYFRSEPRRERADPKTIYARDHNVNFYSKTDSTGNIHPLGRIDTSTVGSMTLNAFRRFIWNPQFDKGYRPHNKDTFILISAGPDDLFGTDDDITNFPLSGENIAP